jgi:hypothetical protein
MVREHTKQHNVAQTVCILYTKFCHGTECSRVVAGRDCFQTWAVAANVLNKQSGAASRRLRAEGDECVQSFGREVSWETST